MANSYEQMRKAGAAARAMLVRRQAQAQRSGGRDHRGARSAAPPGFWAAPVDGEFAQAAAALPVPNDPPLKPPSAFRLIGREGAVHRLDSAIKTNGTPNLRLDIRDLGLLTVLVARPPRFGGAGVARRPARGARRRRRETHRFGCRNLRHRLLVRGKAARPFVTWDDTNAEKRSTGTAC